MAPKGSSVGSKPAMKGPKKKATTFVIDCAKPVEDNIRDIASLEKFLPKKIKVAATKLQLLVILLPFTRDKSKVSVTSDGPFSKVFTLDIVVHEVVDASGIVISSLCVGEVSVVISLYAPGFDAASDGAARNREAVYLDISSLM